MPWRNYMKVDSLISCTSKYDRGLSALHTMKWTALARHPSASAVQTCLTVHRCLRNQAPTYLTDYCVPVSDVAGRRHLRSASRHQLTVPRVRCSTFGYRSFASAGPTVWNYCLTICTIQLLDQTSFDASWRPTCLPVVSVSLTVR